MSEASTKAQSGSTENPADRRRAPRFQADLPVTLSGRDVDASARLKDISALGLCCQFPEAVPEMTLVQVRLDLAKEQDFLAEGAVVRCEPIPGGKGDPRYEVAVFFTNIDKDSRKCLDAYLGTKAAN